jgi:hypothetical protein
MHRPRSFPDGFPFTSYPTSGIFRPPLGNLDADFMPQSAYRSTPVVISGYLYTDDLSTTGTALHTPAWFAWLDLGATFYYRARIGAFTARRELRRQRHFWYAFRRIHGKLRKVYLGSSIRLTREVLDRVADQLAS